MMTFSDYMDQVRADAAEAVREGAAWSASWDEMLDELYIDDSVTGNGSGSYTFSGARALENVRGLLGDADFMDEAAGAGYGLEVFGRDPETLDVIARCLALGRVTGELEGLYESERGAAEGEGGDELTVVVEYELGGEEGGGAYEAGRAPEGSAELGEIVERAAGEADSLAAGGCEWAAVRVGSGGVEDVDAEACRTLHVARG